MPFPVKVNAFDGQSQCSRWVRFMLLGKRKHAVRAAGRHSSLNSTCTMVCPTALRVFLSMCSIVS